MLLTLLACLDHTPPPDGTGEVFIALQSDFAPFRTWPVETVPTTDTGHIAGDRQVYLNANPPAGAESFPVGTILVKTIRWEGGEDIHAMAKRGGGFNEDGAVGWEWFELALADDGTPVIQWRGASPPEGEAYGSLPGDATDTADTVTGDCNACHAGAADNDFVWTREL